MKIQRFEGCPHKSDSFITGVGLTVFKDPARGIPRDHRVEVNVVNEYNVNVGCGHHWKKNADSNCLGMGSLELVIDGVKVVMTRDHKFNDGSGSVTAFNTIPSCSRRWFDFERTPKIALGEAALGLDMDESGPSSAMRGRISRRLSRGDREAARNEAILDVLASNKENMVNRGQCDQWIEERKSKNDLFEQGGRWSTIVIKTKKLSLHIEYKQEDQRCKAHSLDVWVSHVEPDVYDEEWFGVLGETKGLKAGTAPGAFNRNDVLKHPDDEAYEVVSPFSVNCRGGCIPR